MEAEMDKLVKEKEKTATMTVNPLDVVPLTRIIIARTTTTVEIPTTTSVTTTDASEKLTKSIEDMNLQRNEIKILQE
jgi:hypothetical protein